MAGAQLPLAMAHENETVVVDKVKGTAELKQHLSELGFVDGAEVKVVSHVKGDVIVNVKGPRSASTARWRCTSPRASPRAAPGGRRVADTWVPCRARAAQ